MSSQDIGNQPVSEFKGDAEIVTPHHKPGDRFERIREMIELPEENVSATFAPREADDEGLPRMLLFLFGMMIFFAIVMTVIWLGVGNQTVQITLGNHFTK